MTPWWSVPDFADPADWRHACLEVAELTGDVKAVAFLEPPEPSALVQLDASAQEVLDRSKTVGKNSAYLSLMRRLDAMLQPAQALTGGNHRVPPRRNPPPPPPPPTGSHVRTPAPRHFAPTQPPAVPEGLMLILHQAEGSPFAAAGILPDEMMTSDGQRYRPVSEHACGPGWVWWLCERAA